MPVGYLLRLMRVVAPGRVTPRLVRMHVDIFAGARPALSALEVEQMTALIASVAVIPRIADGLARAEFVVAADAAHDPFNGLIAARGLFVEKPNDSKATELCAYEIKGARMDAAHLRWRFPMSLNDFLVRLPMLAARRGNASRFVDGRR